MKCKSFIHRIGVGAAARGSHVNFQTKVACGLHQLHTVPLKGLEAIVHKYNSRLGFHARGLRTLQEKIDQSVEEDEFT
jgi:hypothetical protein